MDWLNEHLAVPTRFSRGRRRYSRRDGICWLKDSATEHVAQLRRLASVVDANGS